jgi:hypothetical protein|tara:strand:- start:20 stop:382 length:363 start_codon:yes stop_codon:yes gene_type:complete
MKKYLTLLTLFLILGMGCSTAQKASEVSAIKVSVAPYLKLSCKELATEQNDLFNQAEAAGAIVDSSHDSDRNVELVTWILFAPAALLLDGNQAEAANLASLRGQLAAVQDAQKVNDCMSG